MIKKWKLLFSRITYEDRWLKIRSDSCQLANGKIIEPFHIIEYPDWINILPITKDLEVILIKQYRHGAQEVVMELAGGIVDKEDKHMEEAAKRELQEETGYGGGKFYEVGVIYPNPANQTNKTYSFLALNVTHIDSQHLDATEDIEVVKMPLHDFLKHITENRNTIPFQALHITNIFFTISMILKSDDKELEKIKESIKRFYSM